MRLSNFTIRKFKAIQEVHLVIPKTDAARPGSADFLSLVGENNTSKSSVLEALRLALPGTDLPTPAVDHFPANTPNNGPIELEFEFDEIKPEDEAEQGIRTHVHGGKYKIKKVWAEVGVRPKIYAYEPVVEFPTWPNPDANKARFEAAGADWIQVVAAYEARDGAFPTRTSEKVRQGLREVAIAMGSPVAVKGAANWVENPGGFASHVDSVLPRAIYIPAIKECEEEAAVSQKKSAARQIVEAMFTQQLAGNPAVVKFAEAGEAVKALFAGGEGNEIVKQVEQRITAKLERLISLSASLDFTPPDIRADLAGNTDLGIIDGTLRTKPEHQGHGAQRSLIMSLLEVLAEDTAIPTEAGFRRALLFLPEEPEIYMHPQMCRKMRDVLLAISRSGTAQVICTTHSPVFLDLADRHDGIAIFRKVAGGVDTFQRSDDLFGGGGGAEDRDRLRMILDFDASVNEVFFAREVCLVEGDCERASLEAVAKSLISSGSIGREKYLLSRRDLSLVNCRGKSTIRAFQRVLNGFHIGYRVVHDRDKEGENGANAAILALLGGDEAKRLVHNPNFERQIFNEDWETDKPWKATKKIEAMNPLNNDVKRFFEFTLGKSITALL